MYVQSQLSIYRHQHHQHDYKNNARKVNLNFKIIYICTCRPKTQFSLIMPCR